MKKTTLSIASSGKPNSPQKTSLSLTGLSPLLRLVGILMLLVIGFTTQELMAQVCPEPLAAPLVGSCQLNGVTPSATVSLTVSWTGTPQPGELVRVEIIDGVVFSTNPMLIDPNTTASGQVVIFEVLSDGSPMRPIQVSSNLCNDAPQVRLVDFPANTCCPADNQVLLCEEGTNMATLTVAENNLTNIVWYNSSDVEVGTGPDLLVDVREEPFLTDLADGSESYYYRATDEDGCDGILCCPVFIETEACFNSSLGDFVWFDEDGDGIQDVGEPGVEGVTVNLKDENGEVIATTMTDINGEYSFMDLAPGVYSVQFVLPMGYIFSDFNADNAGVNGSVNSDADPNMNGMTATVTLVSGENDPNLDAGIVCDPGDIHLACISLINVTLGDDCTAVITPEMVITGNLFCVNNYEIEIDGQPTNILSGCGEHTYSFNAYDENGELFYTCWGTIFAEDKTDPVVDCSSITPINSITTDAGTFDLFCDQVDSLYIQNATYVVNAAGTVLSISTELENVLDLTGYPVVTDNCSDVLVTVSDVVTVNGDCGTKTITRIFTVADHYNSDCIGMSRTASCTQTITFRNPTIADVVLPDATVELACNEDFATDGTIGGVDDNPAASETGYPYVATAFGNVYLNQSYCNLGASYSDEPRINVCEGTYNFRREWNIIDWCDPGNSFIYNQLIKVGDFTGPALTGVAPTITISTSPLNCVANVLIPTPTITDGNGCSNVHTTTYTILANGTTFFAGGNIASNNVVQVPVGTHTLILCAEDDCGNETCEEYTLIIRDEIEPTASCDDDLNVSIGGGDVLNGIEGIARIFATAIDEGSSDNCGEVTLEVRRNYWFNGTCDPSASRWSPWGEYVDFYCCDINNEITIELRVTDESGNQNVCWMVITPEDKLNPYCYAPANVSLTCNNLPLAFPGDIQTAYDEDFAATSIMMSSIFGGATGTDNCAVDTMVERTPNIQVNNCGWGTITRRFEAWQLRPEGDVNGNGAIDINEVFRSTNNCSQTITITEVHDFTIDFPEDVAADCGDPDVPTIITTAEGCDILSINIGEPVFYTANGDACYKYAITYDVINWCLWDGEYTGYVLPRMTEDDGESLPIDRAVEGNERPVVSYNDTDGLVIDRTHLDRDGNSTLADASPVLPNYGRYIYTQFVKVYDSTAPVVSVGEYGGPAANCPDLLPGQFGDDDGNCEEAVSIPFSVADECELFDLDGVLVVNIVSAQLDAFAVDANGDGNITSNEFVAETGAAGNVLSNITSNGDGTYLFTGTFPIITSAMGDNIYHAVRILFEDGCGNQTSETIVFDVIDCKGPAPVCINGLTVTLMPNEGDGCSMAIWAADFEGSPISDCTGQGPELFNGLPRVTKYAIYRAADVEADPDFVPNPNDTGLVLTQDDDASTVVYVYAFDEEGNYDYCETYILVQQHVDCNGPDGDGTIAGVIMTEDAEAVESVEVSINGGMTATMTTNTTGTYSFSNLALGGDYSVTPYLNANPLNGVTTFDIVKISKHILNVELLNGPYKRIAADANRSGTITTLDMIQIRKLILNIITAFPNNTSWRFVAADYDFPESTNPWLETFPELINENNLAGDVLDADFVGVKIGDVNGSAQANALASDDRTLNGIFHLQAEDIDMKTGNTYTVAITADNLNEIEGFQGTLQLRGVELVDIEYGTAQSGNFGLRFVDEGMITTSWNWDGAVSSTDAMHRARLAGGQVSTAATGDHIFSLVLRATEDQPLREALSISSRYTAAEAYRSGELTDLGIEFTNGWNMATEFVLYQNTPNPFAGATLIGFNLPEDAQATLTINDASGRVLRIIKGDYAAGYNSINVTKQMIKGAIGVLSYTVEAGDHRATKQMIMVE